MIHDFIGSKVITGTVYHSAFPQHEDGQDSECIIGSISEYIGGFFSSRDDFLFISQFLQCNEGIPQTGGFFKFQSIGGYLHLCLESTKDPFISFL